MEVKILSTKRHFQGEDILHNLGPGTLAKCIHHVTGNAVGDVVMVTNMREHPLITLQTGELWGTHLENYTFEEVHANSIIIE